MQKPEYSAYLNATSSEERAEIIRSAWKYIDYLEKQRTEKEFQEELQALIDAKYGFGQTTVFFSSKIDKHVHSITPSHTFSLSIMIGNEVMHSSYSETRERVKEGLVKYLDSVQDMNESDLKIYLQEIKDRETELPF